tara:strand:+ start:10168 stop:10605 length:438 start_codon:yes stop_codon:yes gene_type:complete
MSWYTEREIDRVKRKSGVYVMYTGKKNLKYIGYSKDIFDRLLKHEKSWMYVKVKYLPVGKAKDLEHKLIKKLKPKLNVRDKSQALSAKHRIRLKPETYHTLTCASQYSKIRIADLIEQLVSSSLDPLIVKSRKISKLMMEELYEN